MKKRFGFLSIILAAVIAQSTTAMADTSSVGLYIPYGLTKTADGIYFADYQNNRLLQQKNDGTINITAGKSYQIGGYADGKAADALFNGISDCAVNSKGEIFITDSENNTIRKISDEIVITWSGKNIAGYANGSREMTQFNSPMGLAVDKEDNIYVADTLNHVIRKIDKEGNSTLFAGVPGKKAYLNGTLENACFNEPTDIVIVPNGDIYVADSGNQCIRKISGNTVSTVAGTPTMVNPETGYYYGGYADGKDAKFNFPNGIFVMDNGEILVADTLNSAVRKIKTDGTVETLFNSQKNGIDEPVAVMFSNNKYYISQRWTDGIKIISQGAVN